MKKARSTAHEFSAKIREVQNLLLSGYGYSEIQEYGLKWGVSTRQIDDYISGARKIMDEVNLLSLQENIAVISGALWNEYRSASESKDRINCLKELSRIHGLGISTIDVNVKEVRPLQELSDTELKTLREQLKSNVN